MKITIERSVLLKSLGHIQSVVERRGTIPIISNVRLDAGDGRLEMTATDMDVAVVEYMQAEIVVPGAVTLPAHMLYEIVRKLSDGAQVGLEEKSDGASVVISSGRSRFSLSTLPVSDFPVMADDDLAYSFVLSTEECKALFEKTRFAMSSEETRYYLNGVYLHAAESDGANVLRTVATDGHRLARMEVALPSGAAGMVGVIVPRKTLTEAIKLAEEGGDEVKISLSETKIRFVCGNATLVSKLIDGTYPDYERVIPSGNTKVMEVSAADFSKAVDRVSIVSSDKTKGVICAVETGKLTLSVNNSDQSSAQEVLEVSYDADPVEIGFNSRYLLDVMGQIEGETVKLILADSNAPVLIRDTADEGALYVVMPMRV